MSNKLPLVSIACRVYNAEEYIAEAIESILTQTYENWELIIVDDNSTDNTYSIIKHYTDKRIHYYRNNINLGIIGNLNKVLSLCTGEYISILDGDDTYKPTKLEKQVLFLSNHPDYGACFSYLDFIVSQKNLATQKMVSYLINTPSSSRFQMLRKIFTQENFLAFPTEMFRRELLINFPESIIATGDCNFHIHMLLHTKIKVLEEPLVNYRIRGASNTSQWITKESIECENIYLVKQFAKINDLDIFKETFNGLYEEFGEPDDIRDIPYFITRIAMKIQHRFFSGLYLLQCIFEDKDYFIYIMNKFNVSYKDYIAMRMSNKCTDQTIRKKISFCYFEKKKRAEYTSETYFKLFNRQYYRDKTVYKILGIKLTRYKKYN